MINKKIVYYLFLLIFLGIMLSGNQTYADRINRDKKNRNTVSKNMAGKELNEVLRLKLKIFLGVGDFKNALIICREGVKFFPENYYWREWLGNVSIWLGNPFYGINDYYKSFVLTGDKELAKKTYHLATAFHRWGIAEKMIDVIGDSVSLKDTVYVYQMAGDPVKLISLLEKKYKKKKSKKILIYLINIYWEMGNIKKTIDTLTALKNNFGLSADNALMYSNALIAERKYDKALAMLKKSRDKAKKTNYKFWNEMSDLSWMLGDYKTAVEASLILVNMKPEYIRVVKTATNKNISKTQINYYIGRENDYERISRYYYAIRPKIAIKYSLIGWNKYRAAPLFYWFVYTAARQKMWKDIIKNIKKLNRKEFDHLSSNVYFVLTYVNALAATGQNQKAMDICLMRLREKFNSDFLSRLIYLNLNDNNARMLRYILKTWKNAPMEYHNLIVPFISMYIYLKNGHEALRLAEYLRKNRSLGHELLYADILSLYGNTHEAKYIRYKVWREMKKEIKKNPSSVENAQFLESFLNVSMYFESYERFKKTLRHYKNILPTTSFNNFTLSYRLFYNYREKALYIKRKLGYSLKPWMLLNIAIWERDTYLQHRLLKKWAAILPVNGRVEALRQTGNIGEAFDYAFKGLEENRDDSLLYRQFRNIADKYANRIKTSTQLINWEGYREILEDAYVKYNIEGGFSLATSIKIGHEISYDKNRIINVPHRHYNMRLTVDKQYGTCNYKASIGITGSLKNNGYLLLEPDCKITDSTKLKFTYGEHIEDDSSLFLYIGGLKREFKVSLLKNINRRTSFTTSVSQDWYMSQDNTNIGSGNSLYTELSYKPNQGFLEDMFIRIFARSDHYYKNGKNGDIAQLSPFSGFDPLPSSYNLVGAGFSIGSTYKDDLEKSWRPFLSGNAFYVTDSGMGYNIGIGYGGSIFGNDNLSFGINCYTNFQGSSVSYLKYFIDYNIYF